MKRVRMFIVLSAMILASCGGGTTPSPGSTAASNGMSLTATPSTASYSGSSGQQTTISVSGAIGSLTVSADKPAVVSLSSLSSTAFIITPTAGGSTTVHVTDSAGHSTTVPVSVNVCVPPTPAFNLEYPADKSTNSANIGAIWIAVRNGDPVNNVLPAFYPRLIANDGTVVSGGFFSMTSSQPPAGSALPISGYTTYAWDTVPVLSSGTTYQVQIADPGYQCIAPIIVGSFST